MEGVKDMLWDIPDWFIFKDAKHYKCGIAHQSNVNNTLTNVVKCCKYALSKRCKTNSVNKILYKTTVYILYSTLSRWYTVHFTNGI